MAIEAAQIRTAHTRITRYVRRTPVLDAEVNGQRCNLKLEYLQVSGTFKARGAFNRLLSASAAEKAGGVVAASGGNHGIAVALAARALGMKADIFVPTTTPAAKINRLRSFGAQVHQQGEHYAQALAASDEHARRVGSLVSHAYDQPETLAGQGTVALEWEVQAPDLDTVLVAVGGGGLIGGIAAWYAGRVQVVAVESEGCPTLHEALRAGEIVDVAVGGLAADSLGARRVGQLMFPIAQAHVARSLLVSDAEIRQTQHWLWEHLRIAAEPGGATAMAALLCARYPSSPGERIGVLMCGANVDPGSIVQPLPA